MNKPSSRVKARVKFLVAISSFRFSSLQNTSTTVVYVFPCHCVSRSLRDVEPEGESQGLFSNYERRNHGNETDR